MNQISESRARQQMVIQGQSLFERGYTAGGSGNLSLKLPDGLLMTPTGSCLGRLEAEAIAKLDIEGRHISGSKPSKELVLHQAVYAARPKTGAIVHLHSPHAVAVSCLEGLDPGDVLPPLTPYFVMKIGRLPLAPYFPPGDERLARETGKLAKDHSAVLLAHHGTVVSGVDFDGAVQAAEELEETAKLFLMLQGMKYRTLNGQQVAELRKKFKS